MKKRNKSRLTKTDIDTILKLQRNYDCLEQEAREFMCLIAEYEKTGVIRVTPLFDNDYLFFAIRMINDAIKEGRYIPEKKENPSQGQ
jgi:hypothetical protein